MRAIDAVSGPARLSVFDGGLRSGGGETQNLLEVTAEDSAGDARAQCLWDQRNGALLEVRCWRAQRPDVAPGTGLTRVQGGRQALFWLRRIGAIAPGEAGVTAIPVQEAESHLAYRVRSARGDLATISIDRRSGELLVVRPGYRVR